MQSYQGDKLALSEGTVLLKFSATWCGPCKTLAPEMDALALRLAARGITCISVDIDEHPDMCERFHVTAVPTVLKLVNGKSEQVWKGVSCVSVIEEKF